MEQTVAAGDLVTFAGNPTTFVVKAAQPAKLSPREFRDAMFGNLDISKLPFELARQIEAARRRYACQHARAVRRSTFAQAHMAAGLNGKQAVARRMRQIAAGSLRVENGLVQS